MTRKRSSGHLTNYLFSSWSSCCFLTCLWQFFFICLFWDFLFVVGRKEYRQKRPDFIVFCWGGCFRHSFFFFFSVNIVRQVSFGFPKPLVSWQLSLVRSQMPTDWGGQIQHSTWGTGCRNPGSRKGLLNNLQRHAWVDYHVWRINLVQQPVLLGEIFQLSHMDWIERPLHNENLD